ncbi:MAG: ABC transporter substrate-binding protein [Deltaproteobacteria bacterium]|nr:ABC transporter substrate-binding protein [Deltaproteobacteria bacterium]
MNRTALVRLQLLVVFVGVMPFCAGSEAADKVRLSVSSLDAAFLTPAVAYKRGFFKEEGIDPEVIRMNANVSITALATGDIDYTTIFGSVVRAAIRGLPIRVVASFLDSPTQMLVARSEFKSVRELKGKTLGVSSFGATADVSARMMLKYSGVDPDKEMKIVALGADQARFFALKEGIVDVIVISPPADVEGRKLGFQVLARAYELFKFPFVGLGANLKKLNEKPDEVKRVIKALIKANRFVRNNRDGAIEVLMDWGRTSKENATLSYDSVVKVFNADGSIPEDGLQLVIESAAKEAKIARPILASEVADLGALRDAQRELGIKGR